MILQLINRFNIINIILKRDELIESFLQKVSFTSLICTLDEKVKKC